MNELGHRLQDLEAARQVLGGLREDGVRIALDNFGTGYSSLYHLRNFKLDKIKIDKSFIASMNQQAQLLRTGCEQGQGDLYSDALSAEATNAFFASLPQRRAVQCPQS